jgi:hypothetical protein
MIGDSERGYLLELLLTKLHFVGKGKIQIIGKGVTENSFLFSYYSQIKEERDITFGITITTSSHSLFTFSSYG